MKASIKGMVIFLTILVIVFFSNMKATAGDYLGEFCWLIHITEHDDGPADETYLVRQKITHIGGGVFNLQGIVEVPGDNPSVMSTLKSRKECGILSS